MRKCGSANFVRVFQLTAKEHDPTSMRYVYEFMDRSATNYIHINLNYPSGSKRCFIFLLRRSQSQLPSRGSQQPITLVHSLFISRTDIQLFVLPLASASSQLWFGVVMLLWQRP